MTDDMKKLAEAAVAGGEKTLAFRLFRQAATPAALLNLIRERDEARSRVAEAESERDDAVNWGAIVDRHGLDGFDALADTWLRMEAIQRLNNAVTSVFAKWANNELMGRFKEHITNVMHQSFVEGCIVGVRAELVETTKATARAETAEAALAAMGEREAVAYTEGHCAENRKPGGCQLYNLYCGYPDCDRKPIDEAAASPRPEAVEEIAAIAESLRQAYPMEASRILILLGKAQPAAIMATAEPPAPTPLTPSIPDRR